jgi:hypothetical protein
VLRQVVFSLASHTGDMKYWLSLKPRELLVWVEDVKEILPKADG